METLLLQLGVTRPPKRCIMRLVAQQHLAVMHSSCCRCVGFVSSIGAACTALPGNCYCHDASTRDAVATIVGVWGCKCVQ